MSTPYEKYNRKLEKFMEDHDYLGSMIIKGVSSPAGQEAYSHEDDIDPSTLTEEQIASLRYILITPSRADKLDAMGDLILGDQKDDDVLMFNTSFSYHVMATWNTTVKKQLARASKAEQLDLLMAYSYNLKEHDVWMHDYEVGGAMNAFTNELAAKWKSLLLQHSDQELGMDTEYTKPGVLEFLSQFKGAVESNGDLKFDYE